MCTDTYISLLANIKNKIMSEINKHIEVLRTINDEMTPEQKALIYVKENLSIANLIGTEIFGDKIEKTEVFNIYDKIESALVNFGSEYGAHTQDGPHGGGGDKPPKPRPPRATGGVRG